VPPALPLRPAPPCCAALTALGLAIPPARPPAHAPGHSKRVTAARFAGASAVVSGSADKTVRVWRAKGEGGDPAGGYACAATLSDHTGEVAAVAVHPGARYFVSASADGSWAFWDTEATACLKQVGGRGWGGGPRGRRSPDRR
jgi:WD40 repeat protein